MNMEVLKVFGGQVVRVRIQGLGKGTRRIRNELFGIAFDHPLRLQLIAVNLLLWLPPIDARQQGVFDLKLQRPFSGAQDFRHRLHIGTLFHVDVQFHRSRRGGSPGPRIFLTMASFSRARATSTS